MSKCMTICKLCDHLIISTSVTVVGTELVINIPAGSYANCEKYCIVIAQAIPDAATINMPVSISIGGVTTNLYPLTDRCGTQLVASEIRTRTKYCIKVLTNATGGSFKLIGSICSRMTGTTLEALTAETE